MKKLFAWVSLFALLLTFAGCGRSETAKENSPQNLKDSEMLSQTEDETSLSQENITFKRVKSVTIYNDNLTPYTYEITWDGDICSFTMTEFGWDPCRTDASFDAETGAFSVHRKPDEAQEDDVTDVMLCSFDEQGRIISVARTGDMGSFDVSYDENGWPQGDALAILGVETDKESMRYSYSYAGVASSDYHKSYRRVITMDPLGNAMKADSLVITKYNTGETEESLTENFETYTYDEDGNLLKYETNNGYVEFTYTDEVIHHSWERLIPFLCYDFTLIYTAPLFWNLK